jgi:hypothetical protein
MRSWQNHLAIGLACLIIGAMLFLLPFSGSVNSLDIGVLLYLLGTFVSGLGVGILACSSAIYRLEKKQ